MANKLRLFGILILVIYFLSTYFNLNIMGLSAGMTEIIFYLGIGLYISGFLISRFRK